MKKLRFLVLPFAVLGCVLLLVSCKGTGKYYYRAYNSNDGYIEITSDKWITTKYEQDIEWLNDTHFLCGSSLYYCDGTVLYQIGDTTKTWYSTKTKDRNY